MARALKARLAQSASVECRAQLAGERRRRTLHALLAICERVRRGLLDARIDPAEAVSLRHGDAWAAEFAALGGPPDLPTLGEASDDAVADFAAAARFDAKIQAMVPQFRLRPAIDLANSSLAELYAWCIARQPAKECGDAA